jgi:Zn-dependent protease
LWTGRWDKIFDIDMDDLTIIQKVVVWAPPILLAVTFHEVAHGWMARTLGDHTAEAEGRLSLNPLKHVDPIGTVILPLFMLLTSGFIFGWAKPVPVSWKNLKSPRRDMALVAMAGPAANLLMLILWTFLIKQGLTLGAESEFISKPMVLMGFAGISINAVLMILNLLPLPPLDGSRVVSALLPPRWAWRYGQVEPYGLVILVVLMVTGVLGQLIGPPIDFVHGMAVDALRG